MANATPYLSHTSDLPSKFFWVQGESSHKHIFFSMTYSIGLIVTRSQKPSTCVCVCLCVCVCVCVSVCVCESLSRVRLFGTPWTVARQASLSMEFSSHEYWSGLPFSSPVDLPSPGIDPGLLQILYRLSYRKSFSCLIPPYSYYYIITKCLYIWGPICILTQQKHIFLLQRTYSECTLLKE